MKTTNDITSSAAPISITISTCKEILASLYEELGMTPAEGSSEGTCSNQQFGLAFILLLHKLGIVAEDQLDNAAAAWEATPKNPSAMRQAAEKASAPAASPRASAILAKFRSKSKEG